MELLVRTGTYWHVLEEEEEEEEEEELIKSKLFQNTFMKKPNEQALWLRQERLKLQSSWKDFTKIHLRMSQFM